MKPSVPTKNVQTNIYFSKDYFGLKESSILNEVKRAMRDSDLNDPESVYEEFRAETLKNDSFKHLKSTIEAYFKVV